MPDFSDISVVVLGAGLSRRFGADKLSADLKGRPVATHLLDILVGTRWAEKILVATGQSWVQDYKSSGFAIVENRAPDRGLGSSLRLGIDAVRGDHVLICLADMPFISREHLTGLVETYLATERPVASEGDGHRGPPVLAARTILSALASQGDFGARSLLRDADLILAPPGTLLDIDTRADLAIATDWADCQ